MSQRSTFEAIERLGGIVTVLDLQRDGIKYPRNDLQNLVKNGYIESIKSCYGSKGGTVYIYSIK